MYCVQIYLIFYCRNFITCGSEGDVRVWEDVNDTDQKDLCVGEKAWAVFQKVII